MSTKVTILGQEKEEAKKVLKPIEFCKSLTNSGGIEKASTPASRYKNIELIRRNLGGFDLMFAYGTERDSGALYLGHFNDGVVD